MTVQPWRCSPLRSRRKTPLASLQRFYSRLQPLARLISPVSGWQECPLTTRGKPAAKRPPPYRACGWKRQRESETHQRTAPGPIGTLNHVHIRDAVRRTTIWQGSQSKRRSKYHPIKIRSAETKRSCPVDVHAHLANVLLVKTRFTCTHHSVYDRPQNIQISISNSISEKPLCLREKSNPLFFKRPLRCFYRCHPHLRRDLQQFMRKGPVAGVEEKCCVSPLNHFSAIKMLFPLRCLLLLFNNWKINKLNLMDCLLGTAAPRQTF